MKECILAICVVISVFFANGIDNSMPTQQKALHVSELSYTLPSHNDLDSGDINEDLIPFHYDAYNTYILIPIVSDEDYRAYVDDVLSELSIQEEMNAPELYLHINYFGITLEELLESPYGSNYDKDILHAMYLPYEEMLAATMRPQAVYLNGNVYNIKTLNELFQTDKDEFSQFSLDELIGFQERLEENGVLYGFNQDMVDFATQNNPQ
ncbi:MAG: hypothetical protein FWG87_15180 [Defluviitaleaceae bacterium]|nr:hypothetical protein [Defluviitaleaceae bacterium]